MANGASLQNLDQIRDALINRGLGASLLTPQAIQRANLPTLRASLGQSQAELRERTRQRALPSTPITELRGGGGLGRAGGAITGLRPFSAGGTISTGGAQVSGPLGVISVRPTGGAGSTGRVFQVQAAFGTGARMSTKSFKSLNELQTFLKQNPLLARNLVTGGIDPTGIASLSEGEINRLNIPVVSRAEARQVFGRKARPGGLFKGLRDITSALSGPGSGGRQIKQAPTGREKQIRDDAKLAGINEEQAVAFARSQGRI